jgi:hypothetical protein
MRSTIIGFAVALIATNTFAQCADPWVWSNQHKKCVPPPPSPLPAAEPGERLTRSLAGADYGTVQGWTAGSAAVGPYPPAGVMIQSSATTLTLICFYGSASMAPSMQLARAAPPGQRCVTAPDEKGFICK